MVVRLPQPGNDEGIWGSILNDFLTESHTPDGKLKDGLVTNATLANNSITSSKLDGPGQAAIAKASTSVQSVNSVWPNGSGLVTLVPADIGAPTNLADLDDVNALGAVTDQVLAYNQGTNKWTAATVSSTTVNDASNSVKGILQLAGDLGGSNDPTNPTITNGAVTGAKIANTTITDANISASAAIVQTKIQNLTTDLAGKEPTITATTNADYYRGDKTFQALNKAAVGLANVDNTSDANKPVSTATQTALNLKADTSHAHTEADITNLTTDLGNKVNTSEKAAINGVATLDSGGKLVTAQIPDVLTIPPHESTGILSGGLLSINADNTKFDIAAATVFFIDDTIPSVPVRRIIDFPGQTGVSVTNIGTHPATFVGFSQATPTTVNIVQSTAPFTNAERRNWAQLGALVHTNLVNINTINTITQTVASGINQLWDLMQAIGPMNLSGNIFSAAGANLTLRRSSGVMFKAGSGFGIDILAPHRVPLAASAVPITSLRYRTQLAETTGDITNVDPTKWDNAGVLTAVAGTNFTIQRVYLFQSGLARIQYGQATYTNLANAVAALDTEVFVTESNIAENGLLRGFLVVRGNCSDLTNTATAKIVEAAKLSGSAGSGGATLAVRDESVALTANVTQLNFIGAGVVAAVGSGEVTITIPGGAAGFVQLRKSGTQSISDITQTAITWDVEDSDTLAAHANAPNPSRVTVPEDGVYRFTTQVAVTGSTTGVSRLSLYVNGVQQPGWAVCPNSTAPALVSFDREVSLTASQYVEIFVYQNSGGPMTVSNVDPGQSVLTARKVGTV